MTTHPEPGTATDSADLLEQRPKLAHYAVEAVIGIAIAAVICITILTSTGEIPFVYQGY